jgi:hypothetical protein
VADVMLADFRSTIVYEESKLRLYIYCFCERAVAGQWHAHDGMAITQNF